MASFNRVILAGNLTRDIELRHTGNNTAVGSFGLACNRKFGDKDETVFVDCTAWGKTAEIMSQHLGKGKPVLVEGRLSLDQWDDKNGGGKRSKLYVTVESFQFIDSKKEQSSDPQQRRKDSEDEWGDSNDIPF